MVHPSNELYGSDRVLLESIRALMNDWKIEVWLPTDVAYPDRLLSKELDALGITNFDINLPVFRRALMTPRAFPTLVRRYLTTFRRLRQRKPDAVYVNTSALASVIHMCRIQRVPAVMHLHEYVDGTARRVIQPLIGGPSEIIAVSKAITRPLSKALQNKTHIVYNGFNIDVLPENNVQTPLVVAVASRWTPGKGYGELFDAWDLVERRDVELHVLGGPPPSGEVYDVHERIRRLRRPDSVKVIGEVSDIREALTQAHAIIVPSRNPDPLPTIAIEANAFGRAALASINKGGLSEIIEDGVTGAFFNLDSPQELATILETLDVETLQRMGVEGRERYKRLFDPQRFANDIHRIVSPLAPAPGSKKR